MGWDPLVLPPLGEGLSPLVERVLSQLAEDPYWWEAAPQWAAGPLVVAQWVADPWAVV